DALGPLRGRRLGFVLDEHPVEAPDLAIPHALEELPRVRVACETPRERTGKAELADPVLAPADQPRAEPTARLLGMHEPVDVGRLAVRDDDDDRSPVVPP